MIKTRTHGHHGLTAQKEQLARAELELQAPCCSRLSLLFSFMCAKERAKSNFFHFIASLSRHLLFLSKSSFCMRGGSDTTRHNETTAREALFALGLKHRGKEATKAMCKTFNQVDKKHEENWSFQRQLFKSLGFRRHVEFYAAVAFCLATELQTKVP